MEELDNLVEVCDWQEFENLTEPTMDPREEMGLMYLEWWNGKKFTKKEKKHFWKLKDKYYDHIYYDYLSECLVEMMATGKIPGYDD